MERFHILDDAAVILRSKGVYKQAKVYQRAGELFAAYGSGYIRLLAGSGTSLPSVSWLDTDVDFRADRLGRPMLALQAAE